MENQTHVLQEIRYGEDRNTQMQLLRSPQIISYMRIKHEKEIETERAKGNVIDRLSKDHIELNPAITPQLYELYARVCTKLDINLPVAIFIHEKPLVNAGIFRVSRISDNEQQRYVMVITTAALEKLEGPELMFLMGHELGHVIYQHDELEHLQGLLHNSDDDDDDKQEKVGLPPLVERAYLQWKVNREISCDRVGMVACSDVDIAIRAQMKILSGIESKYLTTEIGDIVTYMENLCNKQMDIMEDFRSHPQFPARIVAMARFGSFIRGEYGIDELDSKISSLLRTMSRYPQREVDEAVMHLLTIGGLWIFLHKGPITEKEMNMLVEILYKNFTDYPEEQIVLALQDDAILRFAEANAILCRESIEQKCKYLVFIFCRFALGDGNMDDEEKFFIFHEAEILGIDEQVVFNCIVVLSEKEGLVVDNDVMSLLLQVNAKTAHPLLEGLIK
jgi:hypothetical protein